MPSAVTAIFGADSRPFIRELKVMEILAARSGKNISGWFSMPETTGGSGHSIREYMALFKEFSRGDFSNTPITLAKILLHLGVLHPLAKTNTSAAKLLADAYSNLAHKASLDAIALTKKAAASAVAFQWDAAETEATLNQAVADEMAARAAQANALALQQKAVAASESAVAQESEATASVGAIRIVAAALVGLTLGAYAAYKQTTALIEKLSGFKVPDFEPKYIPEHLQEVNRIAEEWKAINKEIQKAKENYESVAKASERVSDSTKKHFDHLRRMNELSTLPSRTKIMRLLAIDNQERNENLANKIIAQSNFTTEGQAVQKRAEAINVPSKERDQNIADKNKAMFDAANEAAKAIEKSKMEGTFGVNGRDIFRAYNAATDSGVSTKDLDAAEKQVFSDRAKWKKAYENSVNQMAANDETRKIQEELTKKAGESLAKAATTGLEIADLKKTGANASADEAEEAAEKLRQGKGGDKTQVTERERIGAASNSISVSLLDVGKKSLDVQSRLYEFIRQRHGEGGVGGAFFD